MCLNMSGPQQKLKNWVLLSCSRLIRTHAHTHTDLKQNAKQRPRGKENFGRAGLLMKDLPQKLLWQLLPFCVPHVCTYSAATWLRELLILITDSLLSVPRGWNGVAAHKSGESENKNIHADRQTFSLRCPISHLRHLQLTMKLIPRAWLNVQIPRL
jgi:hypothetical protein